jgi:hypothetical protein
MLPCQRKKLPRQGAVKVYDDGREVCANTHAGFTEYRARLAVMEIRQGGRCALSTGNCSGTLFFDHESGRGFSAAIRDDRIEVNGEWHNAALCYHHNSLKGSRRYKWVNGSYLPVEKFKEVA